MVTGDAVSSAGRFWSLISAQIFISLIFLFLAEYSPLFYFLLGMGV